MKNFQTYLNLALMGAIVLLFVFHRQIWPCGPENPATSGNAEYVTTTITVDSTANLVDATPIKPKRVTEVNTTAPTRTQPVQIETPYTFDMGMPYNYPSLYIDTTGVEVWVEWQGTDSVFVNGRFYVPFDSLLHYHATAEYDTTINDTVTDIKVQHFASVRGNRLVNNRFVLENHRATNHITAQSSYPDRFQVYVGPKFLAGGNQQLGVGLLGAGGELSFKFKNNLLLDVGYAPAISTTADPQLYHMVNVDVKPLIRFQKLGDRIRNRRNQKLTEKLIINSVKP